MVSALIRKRCIATSLFIRKAGTRRIFHTDSTLPYSLGPPDLMPSPSSHLTAMGDVPCREGHFRHPLIPSIPSWHFSAFYHVTVFEILVLTPASPVCSSIRVINGVCPRFLASSSNSLFTIKSGPQLKAVTCMTPSICLSLR